MNADPRQAAGASAERQMKHYLHRAFARDQDVHTHDDLRLEDPEQTEHDGSPGVCQIDHLVVHRWGMFIIESKSVTEEVVVRPDGSDGDEWSRVYRGKEMGMASPIQQAKRQSEFLRTLLQRHRKELLGRLPVGLPNIDKLKRRLGGFSTAPIQLIIAVSDGGRIQRSDGWREPQEPFRVFVAKADLVPDKIRQELELHGSKQQGDYGRWTMKPQEAERVFNFLGSRHVDRPGDRSVQSKQTSQGDSRRHAPPPGKPKRSTDKAQAACKHCGKRDLTAMAGRYGYYWRCDVCGKNTAMPTVCSACGTERKDNGVRVRKEGRMFFPDCQKCGFSERIWSDEQRTQSEVLSRATA